MTETYHHRSFDLEPTRPPAGHTRFRWRKTGARGRLSWLPIALALLGACADVEGEDPALEDPELEDEPRSFEAPDTSLILRMRFDDPGDLDAADDVFPDRTLHAECEGTALTPVNDGRRAAGFDGQSSACSFVYPTGVDADGASAVTMAVWVRPREMDGIIYRQHNGPNAGYQIAAVNGVLQVGGRAKGTDPYGLVQMSYPFELDTWHHIVGVIDYGANRISIYLDGALALTQTGVLASGPTFDFTPGSAEMIGAFLPGNHSYFDGRMDEVRVYARGLSNSDVQTLYLATLGDDETEPLVDLEFESNDMGTNSGVGGNCVATGIEKPWAHTWAIYTGQSRCTFPTSTGAQAAGWGSATVSAWVNPTNLGQGIVYRHEVDSSKTGYQLTFANGALRLGGRSATSDVLQNLDYPWPYAANSGWHHVAGVVDYEGRELRLYVDGVLQASSAATNWAQRSLQPSTPSAAGPVTGMHVPSGLDPYQGGLDELHVYTRSFDDDDIAELF